MKQSQPRFLLEVGSVSLPLLRLTGREGLSEIFCFSLEVLTEASFVASDCLLASASLTMVDRAGNRRQVSGIITEICEVGYHDDGRLRVSLSLESGLSRLRQQKDTRIILARSLEDIVRQTLTSHGFSPEQISFRLNRPLAVYPYILQAGENDFDFLARLLAEEGVFFWSGVTDDREESVVFSDSNSYCPTLAGGAISYIPPAGLAADVSPTGLTALVAHDELIPATMAIHDVAENSPSQPIMAEAGTAAAALPVQRQSKETTFAPGVGSLDEAQRRVRLLAEEKNVAGHYLTGRSDVAGLAPGFLFTLEAREFAADYSGGYLITSLSHQASRYSGEGLAGPEEDVPYGNEATLIPRQTPFRPARQTLTNPSRLYSARIESSGEYARLDDAGRYQLRTLFDRSGRDHGEASVPIRRLTPHGGLISNGKGVGFHLPLLDGAEVLISCLNDDPHRPVIIGSLPEPGHVSPVTSRNYSQNILRTRGGNELLMDDAKGAEKISLHTFGGANILELDAAREDHKIKLISEQGALEGRAKKSMAITAGDTISERSGNNRTLTVETRHQTKTNQGEIHHQAKTDQLIKAASDVRLESGANSEFTSGRKMSITAGDDMKITVNGPAASFTVENGDLQIQAKQALSLKGDGGGDISVGQNGGGFTISPDGAVKLFGTSISVSGGLALNGKVNYATEPPAPMPGAAAAAPLAAMAIAELKDEAASQVVNLSWSTKRAAVGETVDAMFTVKNFCGGETANITVHETNPDGICSVIDNLTATLDDGFGHHAVPWRRSEDSSQADLLAANEDEELDTFKYHFEVEVAGVGQDEPPTPLLLTQEVIIEATLGDNETVPDDTAVILTSGDNKKHYGYIKEGKAIFADIVLGTQTITLPAYLHKG
ncbi:MAG: type VI secretion system tip protein TssI/VgrG [Thermodesulfobacteriota bacterium]